MGNLLGVGLGIRLSPFKEIQEKYGIILGKVRAGREGKSRLSRLSLSLGKSHTDKNLVKMSTCI